jgi:hypothetical protein
MTPAQVNFFSSLDFIAKLAKIDSFIGPVKLSKVRSHQRLE